jgi:hypothetical protein
LEIGTGVEIVLTDDAPSQARRIAATATYLSPDQVLSSPKILIGTPEDIGVPIVERIEHYGITHHVMHGTPPDQLAAILAHLRASSPRQTGPPI